MYSKTNNIISLFNNKAYTLEKLSKVGLQKGPSIQGKKGYSGISFLYSSDFQILATLFMTLNMFLCALKPFLINILLYFNTSMDCKKLLT